MRHLLALLLLLRHAPAQRCTSLAGPDCEIINGRAPARPPKNVAPAAKPSSWRERLLGVVRAHLEEGRDRADAVKGAFEVRGDLPDAEGAFELVAGAWLDQPEGWITVGLRGRFEDNCTLSGEITDGEGDIMAACSRFTLQRVDADDAADAAIPLAGAWEGVYVCGGTPTRLVLRLAPDHKAFAREVRGTFSFRVLGEMNEYELREVTRLVGESLVDLDVEDGSDVIVVAGELVDAQDFMLDFDDGGGDVM